MTAESVPSGRDRRFCGGRLRQPTEAHDGTTCTRPAGWGTSHPGWGTCKLHGGSTPSHTEAAEAERQAHEMRQAVQTFGLPVDVEPADALLGLLRTNAGVVAWLGRRVAQLEAEKVTTVAGKTHPLVALYGEERKQLAAVAKAAIDAGIAEREIRLQEDQGRLFVRLVEGALRQLDALAMTRLLEALPAHEQDAMRRQLEGVLLLDPLDERVRAVVSGQLRELGPGEAA